MSFDSVTENFIFPKVLSAIALALIVVTFLCYYIIFTSPQYLLQWDVT